MSGKYKYIDKSVSIVSYAIVVIYSVVTALNLFFNNDDYVWYFADKYDSLSRYINPNGRYFSNYVTRLLVNYSAFRYFFISLTIIALIILLSRMIGSDSGKHQVLKRCTILSLVILLPVKTYNETFLWISGFTNYVFSTVCTLIYITVLFNVLFKEGKFKVYHYFLFPVIALAAGLSIEHIAIYNIILAVALIILLRYKKHKFYIPPFVFLIFSCCSATIMFFDKNYTEIYESGDSLGERGFNFDFSQLLMNSFQYVVPNYNKKLFVINIIIALAFGIISYHKRDILKKSKYAGISMATVLLYTAYSLFTSAYTDTVPLNLNFRIRGFEMAFIFLYLVSLAYLIWIYFKDDKGIKLYFYLISNVLLSALFMFITPVTARCFFVEYIFWILFAAELLFHVIELINYDFKMVLSISGLVVSSCLTAVILSICIVNNSYNSLRVNFMKEQLNSGKTSDILVIDSPYPGYTWDDFNNTWFFEQDFEEDTFFKLYCDYYGIDYCELKPEDIHHISASDYYLYTHS
ncbi:MAG: DUF6056 family protein [Ruminococcus sp.]|nr:DUF6056 family protein [Ruminococcus sp.]